MASTTNYDNGETSGHDVHGIDSSARKEHVLQYISEALKVTLATSQEELESDGAPLAASEVAQSIGRFQAFLSSARPALYAQKLLGPSYPTGA
jgi:hypothetical protein